MIFNRIREYFQARRQQRVMVNLLDIWRANRPLAALWDVRKFADEGYRRNSIIFACVTLKATSFMGPELLAYREAVDNQEVELEPNHMLAKLLARPNRRQSQSAFMRSLKTHLDVSGNGYMYKQRNVQHMPLGLRLLQPDLVRPIVDSNGEIVAYSYGLSPEMGYYETRTLELGKEDQTGNCQIIPAADVIHEMAAPDPLDPWTGLSPIAVLARMGDLDNFAVDYLRAFFLNAGIPSGMLKFKTQVEPTERERVREQWRERYGLRTFDQTGTGGAFDVFVTDADVDYERIGTETRFMDLSTIFGETESRICGVFGVHPILIAAWIGLMRSTMANYEQSRRALYQDTLLPDWVSVADRLTVDLAMSDFGDDLLCKFSLDEVPELQKDKTEERKLALEGWDKGLITKNEGRAVWELPPDAEGEVYKVQANAALEPAALEEEYSLPGPAEPLRLIGGTELQRAGTTEEWRQLHKIADAGSIRVKKKS